MVAAVQIARRELQTFHTKIASVSRENADGTPRQRLVRSCRAGERLVLRRGSPNPADCNAVQVLSSSGVQLGYLNRMVAEEIAPIMDMGLWVGAVVKEITGGTADQRTLGVNIEITRPRRKPRAGKAKNGGEAGSGG